MLEKYLEMPKLRLGKKFNAFSTALNMGRFSVRRDISLIFLCGANKPLQGPSERRNYLKKAIEYQLPHAKIVYAEAVMEELAKHEKKSKNLLDLEHQISSIADWIVIVLESHSSFCELGAFAHQSSRSKLIVINDRQFKEQPSFINLGPIQAIAEDASENQVVWYPMNSDGIEVLDAIGMALPPIVDILRHVKKKEKFDKSSCLPAAFNQISLFFLHDLIHLCGPITHAETIMLYKKIFGDHSFDGIKALRGILHASDLIESKTIAKEPSYISRVSETFINFDSFAADLVSAFRRYHLKHNPVRLLK